MKPAIWFMIVAFSEAVATIYFAFEGHSFYFKREISYNDKS